MQQGGPHAAVSLPYNRLRPWPVAVDDLPWAILEGRYMTITVVLELSEALQRRIDKLAIAAENTPEDFVRFALEAACTPDPRKLQELYALCDQVDRADASPTPAGSP